jgi:hypothetical protein
MTLNASCSGLVAIYYILGYRDAEFQVVLAMIITLYALVMFPFLPESPKLLYEREDYDGARLNLAIIAKWNGVKFDPPPFADEIDAKT